MELNDRVYRLLGPLIRVVSLRAIVVVSALSVIILVIVLGTWVWVGVTDDQYSQLDRRLDSVSSLGDVSNLLSNTPNTDSRQPKPDGNVVRTARIGGITVSVPNDVVLPELPDGYATTEIDGMQYRVRTFTAGPGSIALGAPLGLSGTVTSGIVSALNRNVPVPKASGGTTVLTGAIQTDAAINPGNSGGPLVTCEGRLVGVNTAISTVPNASGVGGGGSVGIGFAVPASTAQRIVDELLANGRATHPWIGAVTAEITQDMADRFGTPSGLFVQDVGDGGPADAAGLETGDIITRLGGNPATSLGLGWLLVSAKVGDDIPIEFARDGVKQTATLTLAEQPA